MCSADQYRQSDRVYHTRTGKAGDRTHRIALAHRVPAAAADDPRQRRRDISKANDAPGWAPKTALAEGPVRTIGYFEELLRDETIRPFILHEQGGA